MQTPWGKSDYQKEVTKEIVFHATPGHGGYKVYDKQNKRIPDYMRKDQGWYEEDCEWALVVVSLPEFFPEKTVLEAKNTFRNWFPKEYEQFYGVTLAPGESYINDHNNFDKAHENDMVVVSALGTDNHMVICMATKGGKRSHEEWNHPKWYLITSEKYSTRKGFSYVIQPEDQETALRF